MRRASSVTKNSLSVMRRWGFFLGAAEAAAEEISNAAMTESLVNFFMVNVVKTMAKLINLASNQDVKLKKMTEKIELLWGVWVKIVVYLHIVSAKM